MSIIKSIPLCVAIALISACSDPQSNDPVPTISGTYTDFPATNGAPTQLDQKFNSGQCQIKTTIASIGTGTDKTHNGVGHALFDHQYFVSDVVNDLYHQAWGREGEFSFCAQVLNPADLPILEQELNQIVTNFTGTIRGVVRVETN